MSTLSDHPFASFFPDNVKANPQDFIGPSVTGALVQGVELGILINQSTRFWARSSKESAWIKVTVVLAMTFAALQTMISFYGTWRLTVYNFGDYIAVVNLNWSEKCQPLLNTLTAAPVQAFLVWRCWNATNRRWFVVIPLSALLVASVIASCFITADIFKLNAVELIINPPKALPYSYICGFVLTAALDIAITSLMLWFLLSAKANVISERAHAVIDRLLRTLWEAAVPPCVCAIVAMALYISMSRKNFWDVFVQTILGKLYVISLFVVLNGRADLREMRGPSTHVSTHQGVPSLRGKRSGTKIRIHIATEVERVKDQTGAKSSDFDQPQKGQGHIGSWGIVEEGHVDDIHLSTLNDSRQSTQVNKEHLGTVYDD